MLRALVARDAGELFMLVDAHRGALRNWLPWVDGTTAVADMNYYILSLTGLWKSGITLGIFEDETLCGTVGFHRGDHRHQRAEVGYWLAPPFQGRGLAFRAVRMVLRGLATQTQIQRVEARVQASNKRSLTLLKKLGFQFEGIERSGLRYGKEFRDHHVYSLLRAEFPE